MGALDILHRTHGGYMLTQSYAGLVRVKCDLTLTVPKKSELATFLMVLASKPSREKLVT